MDRQEELLSRALALEESVGSKTTVAAKLKAAIESAEFYMQALRVTENPEDRKLIKSKCNEMIERAKHLKLGQDASPKRSATVYPVSMRKLTTRENIIILEGSRLNGYQFMPWERAPLQEEFALQAGQEPFVDSRALPLSETQLKSFGGWKRPKEALDLIEISKEGHALPKDPTMSFPDKVDLVQDLTSDCSVVASLCAGTSRIERGHPKVSHPPTDRHTYQSSSFQAPSYTPTTTPLRPSCYLRTANTSIASSSTGVGDEWKLMTLYPPPQIQGCSTLSIDLTLVCYGQL